MANIKSMKKDLRRNAKRRTTNQSMLTSLKTHVKKVRVAAIANSDELGQNIVNVQKALDKAAQRGIIHKNQAARRKSRIMKLAAAAASGEAVAKTAAPKKAGTKKAVVKKTTKKSGKG